MRIALQLVAEPREGPPVGLDDRGAVRGPEQLGDLVEGAGQEALEPEDDRRVPVQGLEPGQLRLQVKLEVQVLAASPPSDRHEGLPDRAGYLALVPLLGQP